MPPPNVTGALHIGHGLTGAVEVRDFLNLRRILCGDGGFIPEFSTLNTVFIVRRNLQIECACLFTGHCREMEANEWLQHPLGARC